MKKHALTVIATGMICLGVYFTGHKTETSRDALLGIWIMLSGLEIAFYIKELEKTEKR